MWGEVSLFYVRILSQHLLGGKENNSDLSQDNTFTGLEQTLHCQKRFISVFGSIIPKKYSRKAIAVKSIAKFDIKVSPYVHCEHEVFKNH
jgi:hypothetical protein